MDGCGHFCFLKRNVFREWFLILSFSYLAMDVDRDPRDVLAASLVWEFVPLYGLAEVFISVKQKS